MRKLLGALLLLLMPVVASAQYGGGAGGSVTNAAVNTATAATLGAELAPAISAANWTCGAGWDTSVAGTLNKNADGTTACSPTTPIVAVVGTTYKITITVGAVTVATSSTYSLGGTTGTSIAAATTYTDYLTAATTATFILTASPTNSRFTVTAVSIKALTDATGDLTVEGNLIVRSPSTFNGTATYGLGAQILGSTLGSSAPAYSFSNEPSTGLYFAASGFLGYSGQGTTGWVASNSIFRMASTLQLQWSSGSAVSTAGDTILQRDGAANTLALRNSTNPQTFNIYNTYTDASNYEKASLYWSGNSFIIQQLSAGSGSSRPISIRPGAGTFFDLAGSAVTYGTDSADFGTAAAPIRLQYLSRGVQGSKTKSLVDAAAAASFVRIAVPTNGFASGRVIYTATSTDGTNILVSSGSCEFAAADTAGTVTAGTPTCDTPSTAYKRANTLVCTISGAVSTTNYDLQATCTDNLAGTQTVTLYYRLDMPFPNTVTPQ